MKSLKRRIGLHFSLQFILIFVLVLVILFMLLFLLLNFIMKEDMKRNFPIAALDTIATETYFEDDKPIVQGNWKKDLQKEGMWFQIIDKSGLTIYEINTPSSIPMKYTAGQLLEMQESQRFGNYTVQLQMDTYYDSYLYILGYENETLRQLDKWVSEFGKDIQRNTDSIAKLEKEINKFGYLHIVDENGHVIRSFGKESLAEKYEPVEIIERKLLPEKFDSAATIYNDANSGLTWILYSNKENKEYDGSNFIKNVTLAIIAAGLVMLVITIGFTIWHAFRYGRPLLLFISWLERLGQGEYDTLLTEKDRKKVFTKKGKIRSKFKLYKEVIQSFYDMAEKLEKTRQDRDQLERTREEWMTGISHDLRTPLATIQGYGHMLESGHYEWSGQELEDMGKTIREKGTYMLGLVEDFSLAFQLKNNKIPLVIEKVDVNKTVHHLVLDYVNDVTIKNVSFSFEKRSDQDLLIHGDVKMISRALDNLLYNAVKHNPDGTRVIVSTNLVGNEVFIKIEDNGIGMDEETRNNLFDRYYRGTNTEEKTDGAGLGLSITKAIIESHNGTIDVVSSLGLGTKFILRLPEVNSDRSGTRDSC
ncbi:sensor histidine kinase [Ferdinandcohnia quinoae]|uniref:histidine kinase n=1 Tax=Fredinandcohnia quinoae TaxID=2918902 RepID=A0AAW5E8C5_9BACI|nr:HAMP domain-containing histidine kinase [Fredinandcohnia sp. SECRCQ15]